MFSDILNDIEKAERLSLDTTGHKPSWYALTASYLRHFQHDRHGQTSDLLPKDRRLVLACRRLYRMSDATERGVMDGSSELSSREKSRVFSTLCYKLARLSGLTTTILLPSQYERNEKDT